MLHPHLNPALNIERERKRFAALPLVRVVDELGLLKAAVAELTSLEETLKQRLIDSGKTELDGGSFRATVVTADRTSTDKVYKERLAALIAKGMSHQFIAAHTTTTESVSVRVVAKVRDKVAA